MGSFKHFHEESVDRCVTDQLKEEQVLQALQADGPQRRQPQEELGEPVRGGDKREDRGDELRTVTVQAAAVRSRYLPCCSGYLCLQ